MDKNTLIAIGLSAAILIVWNVLFPPPPPQQAPEPSVEKQTTVSRSQETVEENESIGETLPSTISDVPKVSTSMLSRDIEVETANYVMVFDTRGGQAKSPIEAIRSYQTKVDAEHLVPISGNHPRAGFQ